MKIPINEIKVDREHRIRTDSGDLTALQNSIARVGLLNPVVVDEKHKLVAGFRRLSACRKLGWKEIEVRVVKLSGDPLLELDAEWTRTSTARTLPGRRSSVSPSAAGNWRGCCGAASSSDSGAG